MDNPNNQSVDSHEQSAATVPQVSQAATRNKRRIVAGIAAAVSLVILAGITILLAISTGWLSRTDSSGNRKRIKLAKGVTLDMVKIEAGSFTMGDVLGNENETPHQVTITQDYYLGKTEVTQAQWKAVKGNNPSYYKGDNLPVENVSWNDAMDFCDKLNSMGKAPEGYKFTLPTEAQWEYAARGGEKSRGFKYSGSNDIGDVAWYEYNSRSKTHEVATKKPNELRLYDMSGNVWELCLDWYGAYSGDAVDPQGASIGSFRVYRGGGWDFSDSFCRSTSRICSLPSIRNTFLGFRLALVPSQ